jgi:ABC-type multidrug transport system fused ATPase/permease subunit
MNGKFSEVTLLCQLAAYALRKRPSIVPITLVGVASSFIELAAMLSIIPISILAGGKAIEPTSGWHRLADLVGAPANAKFYTALFLSLMALRSITFALSIILNQYTMRELIAHFSSRALESFVHHLSFKDVQKEQAGHFLTLAGDEANRGANIVTALMKLVPYVLLFALYITALFYSSWRIGLGLLAFMLLALALLGGAFKRTHSLGQRQQDESRRLNTHFIDSLSGLRTVRGFTAEAFVSNRYREMIGGYARTCFLIDALNAVASNLPTVLLMFSLLLGALFLVDNAWLAANMAVLLAGTVVVLRLLPLANQALDVALKLTADLRAARNISEVLAAIAHLETHAAKDLLPIETPITRIEFRNVSFQYRGDTPRVLDNFNVTFEAGRSYALTGASGSGKSSMIDLLLKLFEPDSGAILVNGEEIRKLDDSALRRRIVLAEQTTRLFYDTVLHNVQFGYGASDPEARDALRIVDLDTVLETLPDGAETLLAYQGSNLSGGQRQRVGLARALLRSADVLILDESTNALDFGLRKRIMDTLLAKYADRIIIFVTHDPYVSGRVDKIIQLSPPTEPAQANAKLTVVSAP